MSYGDSYGAPRGGGDRMGGLGSGLGTVDWGSVQKVEGSWNYYQGSLVRRSQEEIAQWLKENSVIIVGERVPAPMLSFSELTAPEGVHRAFAEQKFANPTAIQAMSWPIVLSSRDLVGIAKTGSGKTLAFIVPAILHIAAQAPLKLGDGPIALVLAPTRELAVQIDEETIKVVRKLGSVNSVVVYGGVPKFSQQRALRAGVHICIATPGRLIDMLESRATNLLRVTYLVLDEADRMLDMGFEPQIRAICSQIRPDRQTLMFSATWPEEIRQLAASFQRDFIRIHVGSIDLSANADVRQHILAVQEHEKPDKLRQILSSAGRTRCLIFVKMKRSADHLHDMLVRAGINAAAIHGDKEQGHRDRVLMKFRREDNCVLVATDVAARGLDIKDLDIVVNYDFPMCIEDYVHRIGRTGRAGKTGDAYSFVVAENAKLMRELKGILIKAGQPVPEDLNRLEMMGGPANRSRFGGGGGGGMRNPGYPPRMATMNQPSLGQYANAPPNMVPAGGMMNAPPKRSRSPTFQAYDSKPRRRSRSRSDSRHRDRDRRRHSRSRSPVRRRRERSSSR